MFGGSEGYVKLHTRSLLHLSVLTVPRSAMMYEHVSLVGRSQGGANNVFPSST